MGKGIYKRHRKYPLAIGFMADSKLKKQLENFAKENGLNPSIVCRKALIEYLEKGIEK